MLARDGGDGAVAAKAALVSVPTRAWEWAGLCQGGCGAGQNALIQSRVARLELPAGLGEGGTSPAMSGGGRAGTGLPDGPGAQASPVPSPYSPYSLTKVPLTVGPSLLGTPDGRDLGGEAKAFQGQKVAGILSQAFVLRNRRKHKSTRKTGPRGAVGGAPL